MKYRRLMAVTAVAALSALVLVSQTLAQGLPPAGAPVAPARAAVAPRPSSIAMLNVAYIFDNHPKLKKMRDDMKGDLGKADAYVKGETEGIKAGAENLEKYRGKPEFNQLEEQLARRNNELRIVVAKQRKEFMLREARMYHDIYQEIVELVDYYCQQNGIDLVVRFNPDKIDPENPDTVLAAVNKLTVWHSPSRDITGPIMNTIYSRYGVNPATGTALPTTPGTMTPPFNKR